MINDDYGKKIILCGMSASGKDTIAKELVKRFGFKPIICHTTRPIRENEVDGESYFFINKEEFKSMIENNEFIEYKTYNTLVNGVPDVWYYGTSKKQFEQKKNFVAVLDIDGVKEIKKYFDSNIFTFFIDCDVEVRRKRSISRGGYDKTEFDRREITDSKRFSKNLIKENINYIIKSGNLDDNINEIVEVLDGTYTRTVN